MCYMDVAKTPVALDLTHSIDCIVNISHASSLLRSPKRALMKYKQ